MQWLTPVIPALREAEVGLRPALSFEVRVRDQPGQQSKTLLLLKIQKLPGCGGGSLLGRLREENRLNLRGGSCSEVKLCHYTPAWADHK